MKKGNSNQGKNNANAYLEEVYELVVQTAKDNLQSAMDAWQNLVKADNLSAAFDIQSQFLNEAAARNANACRQMCEMHLSNAKNASEPFMQNVKDAFEKFKVNPIA